MTKNTRCWRRKSSDRVLIRTWEDDGVAYQLASGDTHYLDGISLILLDLLTDQALTDESIVSILKDETTSPDLTSLVSQHLHELAKMGLVEISSK